jgi:hypothetical protein
MIESAQDHGEQKPETVEDLAPRENDSAGLKGGMSSENANVAGEVHVSGGGKKT